MMIGNKEQMFKTKKGGRLYYNNSVSPSHAAYLSLVESELVFFEAHLI